MPKRTNTMFYKTNMMNIGEECELNSEEEHSIASKEKSSVQPGSPLVRNFINTEEQPQTGFILDLGSKRMLSPILSES